MRQMRGVHLRQARVRRQRSRRRSGYRIYVGQRRDAVDKLSVLDPAQHATQMVYHPRRTLINMRRRWRQQPSKLDSFASQVSQCLMQINHFFILKKSICIGLCLTSDANGYFLLKKLNECIHE